MIEEMQTMKRLVLELWIILSGLVPFSVNLDDCRNTADNKYAAFLDPWLNLTFLSWVVAGMFYAAIFFCGTL